MKKLVLVWVAGCLLIVSCANEPQKNRPVNNDLSERNKKLVTNNIHLHKSLNTLEDDLLGISEYLDHVVYKNGGESTVDKAVVLASVKKTQSQIKSLDRMLDNGRYEVEKLTHQLTISKSEEAFLLDRLTEAKEKLNLLSESRDSLERSLEDHDANIAMLMQKQNQLHMELDAADLALNEVSFAFGTKQELLAQDVLLDHGALLNLFARAELSNNLNETYFTAVDKRALDIIPIYASKAKLITKHPPGSFSFCEKEGKIECLKIEDKDEFWKFGDKLAFIVQ